MKSKLKIVFNVVRSKWLMSMGEQDRLDFIKHSRTIAITQCCTSLELAKQKNHSYLKLPQRVWSHNDFYLESTHEKLATYNGENMSLFIGKHGKI